MLEGNKCHRKKKKSRLEVWEVLGADRDISQEGRRYD